MAKNNKGNRSQGQNQGRGNQGGGNQAGGNQGGQQQRKGNQSAGGASRGLGNLRGGEFELDNLTYNIITVLHEKSKGLEAYDKYLQDARGEQEIVQIFEEMRQDDQRHIQRLEQALRTQLGSGGGEIGGEEMEEDEEAA